MSKDETMEDAAPRAPTVRASGDDAAAEIALQLEEDIVFGRLQPRERLIEEDLATRFDAKRHIVRKAILDLERLGLVERARNRGAVVRLYSEDEVENINQVRDLLETHAASLIPVPATEEAIATLMGLQQRHAQAVRDHDRQTVFRSNILFHRALYSLCGNAQLVEAINGFAQKSHAYRSILTSDTEYMSWAADAHFAMIEALRTGDSDRLVALCRAHLEPAKTRYIETWRSRFA